MICRPGKEISFSGILQHDAVHEPLAEEDRQSLWEINLPQILIDEAVGEGLNAKQQQEDQNDPAIGS